MIKKGWYLSFIMGGAALTVPAHATVIDLSFLTGSDQTISPSDTEVSDGSKDKVDELAGILTVLAAVGPLFFQDNAGNGGGQANHTPPPPPPVSQPTLPPVSDPPPGSGGITPPIVQGGDPPKSTVPSVPGPAALLPFAGGLLIALRRRKRS